MKKLTILLLSALFLFIGFDLEAKAKYKLIENVEGVNIHYKWRNSKFFKKDSPMILFLKIENTNDYNVNAEFVVDYYWKLIRKASSPDQTFCVKANRSLKGKINRLDFDSGEFTNEQLLSEDFILEFSGLQITKIQSCKEN